MIELLALPAWRTPPRTLEEWTTQLGEQAGGRVAGHREPATESWLELSTRRLRGYAVLEGPHVEAINFELSDPDPAPATRAVEAAAAALGWEIHPDEDEDEDDED